MSRFQHAWLSGLTRMGWPSWWQNPDLEVGKLRLVFYTVSELLSFEIRLHHDNANGRRQSSPLPEFAG